MNLTALPLLNQHDVNIDVTSVDFNKVVIYSAVRAEPARARAATGHHAEICLGA